jgi:hypothetical protein
VLSLVLLEGVVVAILAFLVVGLLRSHAEILGQLHQLGLGGPQQDTPVELRPLSPGEAVAHDLVGETPAGETVAISVTGAAHTTLVAFLSSGCATCRQFWGAFRSPGRLGLPPNTRLVAVTRGPEAESVTAIAAEAPADLTVVMSTAVWENYRVPGSPYFVLVDGPSGAVIGEGTGTSWTQVQSLMGQALGDRSAARRRRTDRGRMNTDDAELLAAGVGPGHPSLFAGPPPPIDTTPAPPPLPGPERP